MRKSAIKDCKYVLKQFAIKPRNLRTIDVGGTKKVCLDGKFTRNPLLNFNKKLTLLDKGFNVQTIKTETNIQVDFLDINAIRHLKKYFDIVYSFDTLEHISNPFRFCEYLVYITKPGGYIYISTVFEWPYHPSPDDYFRYSPEGLHECFKNPANRLRNKSHILWCDWETDRRAVALLARVVDSD